MKLCISNKKEMKMVYNPNMGVGRGKHHFNKFVCIFLDLSLLGTSLWEEIMATALGWGWGSLQGHTLTL